MVADTNILQGTIPNCAINRLMRYNLKIQPVPGQGFYNPINFTSVENNSPAALHHFGLLYLLFVIPVQILTRSFHALQHCYYKLSSVRFLPRIKSS